MNVYVSQTGRLSRGINLEAALTRVYSSLCVMYINLYNADSYRNQENYDLRTLRIFLIK